MAEHMTTLAAGLLASGAGAGSGRLRVVERVALGPDRALVLVRAGGFFEDLSVFVDLIHPVFPSSP